MQPIIECKNVTKSYPGYLWGSKKVTALIDVNWTVFPGQRWLVTGPNRAGKSTLLRLLVSLIRPDAGQVHRSGQLTSCAKTLQGVGYLPEDAHLPGHWRVEALISWVASLHKLPAQRLRLSVAKILHHFQLKDYASAKISQLSRGLRQRVGLACSLVHHPKLVVLDSPCDSLDELGLSQLFEWLRRTVDSQTVIIAQANALAMQHWASHVLELRAGRIVYSGEAEDYFRYRNGRGTPLEDICHAISREAGI
ncbi:putative ABC transporter ATP-binding protein YbhF [bacterium HR36]|nr:putative ABC transporter ATP-binding protein YbhF [bacterium HR36]